MEIKVADLRCRSGIKIGERARVFAERFGRRLLVVVAAEPLGTGLYTCQAVNEPTLSIRLRHPVGLANVYDGATLPPIPAGEIVERYRR